MRKKTLSSRDFLAAAQALLLTDWDPIGVRDEPAAQDEYDAYAEGVLDLLEGGASQARLADFFVDVEMNRMGLEPDRQRAETVAGRLLALAREIREIGK